MRRKWFVAIVVAMMLCLTGCWDSNEVDDHMYVLAIGIDKLGDGISVTIQLPQNASSSGKGGESSSGGSGGGGESEVTTATVSGHNFLEAIDVFCAVTPRVVNLLHLKVVFISEELAQSDMYTDVIDQLVMFRRLRTTATVIICKGKAGNWLDAIKEETGLLQGKAYEIAINAIVNNSYAPMSYLITHYSAAHNPYTDVIAAYSVMVDESTEKEAMQLKQVDRQPGDYAAEEVPYTGPEKVRIFGSALFNEQNMVGTLTGQDTELLLLAQGSGVYSLVTLQGDDGQIWSFHASARHKAKKSITYTDGKYHISLYVPLYIVRFGSDVERVADVDSLKQRIDEELEQELTQLMQKLIEQGVDPLGLRGMDARRFSTTQEFMVFDWDSAYSDAVVSVEIDSYIATPGRESMFMTGNYR